jgi:hypothetical protein
VFEHVHFFLQFPFDLLSHVLEDYKPGVGLPASDLGLQTSDLGLWTSGFGLDTSGPGDRCNLEHHRNHYDRRHIVRRWVEARGPKLDARGPLLNCLPCPAWGKIVTVQFLICPALVGVSS